MDRPIIEIEGVNSLTYIGEVVKKEGETITLENYLRFSTTKHGPTEPMDIYVKAIQGITNFPDLLELGEIKVNLNNAVSFKEYWRLEDVIKSRKIKK